MILVLQQMRPVACGGGGDDGGGVTADEFFPLRCGWMVLSAAHHAIRRTAAIYDEQMHDD